MQNYLIGWQYWEIGFNGDTISMHILPLKRGEFLRLLPVLDDFYKLSQRTGEGVQNASEMGDILERVEPVIAAHIKDIKGFQIDGADPKVEDVIGASVFMPLIADVVFKLVEISKVERIDEKNSVGQSTNIQ